MPERRTVPWRTPDEVMRLITEGDGDGVRVAVVDSGVDPTHPDFGDRELEDDIAVVADEVGASKMRKLRVVDGEQTDVFGHGTAVAGIIWEVAPKTRIGSIRVLGEDNRSKTDIVCYGARQAIERGYHIINCSLGCTRPDHLAAYKTWIDQAYLKGIHVVAACSNVNFRRPEWPGHFTSVITVNMARTDAPLTHYYRPGHLVEYAARGVEIRVPWRYQRTIETTGSSFAAPRVTGLLARMLSLAPDLNPHEAMAMLHHLAEPWTDALSAPNEEDVERPQVVPKMGIKPPSESST